MVGWLLWLWVVVLLLWTALPVQCSKSHCPRSCSSSPLTLLCFITRQLSRSLRSQQTGSSTVFHLLLLLCSTTLASTLTLDCRFHPIPHCIIVIHGDDGRAGDGVSINLATVHRISPRLLYFSYSNRLAFTGKVTVNTHLTEQKPRTVGDSPRAAQHECIC